MTGQQIVGLVMIMIGLFVTAFGLFRIAKDAETEAAKAKQRALRVRELDAMAVAEASAARDAAGGYTPAGNAAADAVYERWDKVFEGEGLVRPTLDNVDFHAADEIASLTQRIVEVTRRDTLIAFAGLVLSTLGGLLW